MALLVGDLRAEIQQAVNLLRGEASATKHPIAAKLLMVVENLQHAEKEKGWPKAIQAPPGPHTQHQDALGKMRELLTHSHWDLGHRMDQQMQAGERDRG